MGNVAQLFNCWPYHTWPNWAMQTLWMKCLPFVCRSVCVSMEDSMALSLSFLAISPQNMFWFIIFMYEWAYPFRTLFRLGRVWHICRDTCCIPRDERWTCTLRWIWPQTDTDIRMHAHIHIFMNICPYMWVQFSNVDRIKGISQGQSFCSWDISQWCCANFAFSLPLSFFSLPLFYIRTCFGIE